MNHRVKIAVISVPLLLAGTMLVVSPNQESDNRLLAISSGPHVRSELLQPANALPASPETVVQSEPLTVPANPLAPTTELHTAQRGETVDGLAADLRGKETRAFRQAILNANPSLQADPDKLIAGKTYILPSPAEVPARVESRPAIEPAAPVVVNPPALAEPIPEMNYIAHPGDTVTSMSAAFLGSVSKAHQDTIVSANASLHADPDKVVAGRSYTIPTPNGLTAVPTVGPAEPQGRPAVQPDADQIVAAGSTRNLTYVARPGDTVTSMALALLGADTQDNRSAIIQNNPSLKSNPDRVLTGQTYSIPAPAPTVVATPD